MNVRFIENGNFIGWMRLILIILGVAMTYCGLAFHSLPKLIAVALVVLGLPISSIGGYSSRAKALGLKPFEKKYRKVRDSYK